MSARCPVWTLLVVALLTVPAASAHLAPGENRGGLEESEAPGEDPQGGACSAETPPPVANLTGATFDGNYTVRVNYTKGDDASRQAAEHVLEGGRASYEAHVADWGFHSDDPDGVLEYSIVEGDVCTVADDDLKIKIAENLTAYAEERGLNYTSGDALYNLTTHHETNHHFLFSAVDYYTEDEWSNWSWIYNGFAATSETWFDQELSALEDSPFHENQGADDYVRETNTSIFERGSHTNDLYLGYLYANDGGLDLYERIWGLRSALHVDADPKRYGPEIFDQALAHTPGAHDSLAGSLEGFAYDLVRRENLSWAPPTGGDRHDWTAELEEVVPIGTLDEYDPSVHGSPGAWALEFTEVDPDIDATLILHDETDDGNLSAAVYERRGPSWERRAFEDSHDLTGEADEVVVTVLRNASTSGDYTLELVGTNRPATSRSDARCLLLGPLCGSVAG